jgi:hypothetical protein
VGGYDLLPATVISTYFITSKHISTADLHLAQLTNDMSLLHRNAAAAVISLDVVELLDHSTKGSCKKANDVVLQFFRNLRVANLLHIESASLIGYRTRALIFDAKDLGSFEPCPTRAALYSKCPYLTKVRKSVLTKIDAVIGSTKAQGYCLDCVYRATGSMGRSQCRVTHAQATRFLT